MTPIILEKGYNTSGLYAFIISLFMYGSESMNRLLSMDCTNASIMYIQEYIKHELVFRLRSNRSLTLNLIDRLRNILFCYKWRYDIKNDVVKRLCEASPVDLYRFLVSEMMDVNIEIEVVDPKKNRVDTIEIPTIDIPIRALTDDSSTKCLDLADRIQIWIEQIVSNNERSYRFKDIPHIVPIVLDREDNAISAYDVPVNIKEVITFPDIDDTIQKMFVWEVHSIILYDRNSNEYSALVRDDVWCEVSESWIPSNREVDMKDQNTVNRIARQATMVFYKLK